MTQPFPDWVVPMAATLTYERFNTPEWLFERKLDGIRMLAFRRGATVRLFSRNHLPQNDSYPAIVRAVAQLPVDNVILDGEAMGMWGTRGAAGYHVFDMLWLDGQNLMTRPLDERRARLRALPFPEPMVRVEELTDAQPWLRACELGWEGVIAKRRDSAYVHKRSPNWLKMKCEASQELVVGGFTDPQRGRVGLGALLVGYYEGNDFVFAGKVGTGFDTRLLNELRAQLDRIEITEKPFTRGVGVPRLRAHWVRPEIVVQVGFMEWTVHGKLRHPRLIGVRTDKAARDVVRESA